MTRYKGEEIGDETTPGQMVKYVIHESKWANHQTVQEADIVYYFHETRYDNGQLVELEENRKAKEKFEMADDMGLEHLKMAFLTMRKGEISWIKFGPKYHNNVYHK